MGIKEINNVFLSTSTKSVSTLKYLSESSLIEGAFLLVTMGDFEVAHRKYYESLEHAEKVCE